MPSTEVVFYRDDDGTVPVLDWLGGLSRKARLKCLVRIERLRELEYDLRRPEADLLRDGVYELRVSLNHIQYRILYSFHTHTESDADRSEGPKTVKRGSVKPRPKDSGQPVVRRTVAVLAHGLVKEDKVPNEEIDRALARMRKFAAAPERYTFAEE
jgi:phage-related protein